MKKLINSIGEFILDTIEVFAVAGAIFAVVYLFLVQPHNVEGKSMEPSFHHGEYVLTSKILYRFSEPERGDVIIFKYPQQPKDQFIKRIIALPGETFEIKFGQVYIYNTENKDGFALSEYYLKPGEKTRKGKTIPENQKIKVPKDSYIVMGDNRNNSSDSREWGFVPRDNIIGKAWFRYFPLGSIGKIKEPDYTSGTL